MPGPFTQAQLEPLSRPHVARAWFLEADLPAGLTRWHNGTGRKIIGGQEWRGVTDPIGGQIVSISDVEDPRFGSAAAVTIGMSGANLAFFRSVHKEARAIEGRDATLYFAAFDGETESVIGGLVKMFRGKMTSPGNSWSGIGVRAVSLTVVGIWESQNYSFGGQWTPADQKRRYPGDKGLDFVGVKVSENWK